jgi:hypothetical protein
MRKFILVILIFACVSCDLFTTRDSETPTSSGNASVPATSVDILFSNLQSSLGNKILENYLACLVDTSFLRKKFKFIASSGSSSQYPILNGWNYESERQYFKNLKAIAKTGQLTVLTLSNLNNTQLGSDSSICQIDYSLSFPANDQTISGTYQGSAQFKIYRDSRLQWVIVEWTDFRKENIQSWSELKARCSY